MKHPPYHLRVNKAIDRFLLVDILDILKRHCDISNYTYYGLGGPYLEDCRLIHARCPEVQIVSIEGDNHTFKRQEFHRFTKNLKLINEDFSDFFLDFSSSNEAIFWLDYIDRGLKRFSEFSGVLGEVWENSVVKITIPAERDGQHLKDFKEQYPKMLPPLTSQYDIYEASGLVKLLQDMLQLVAQQALRASGSVFQLLNSSYYKDSSQMLSVTGIVCNKDKVSEIQQWFKDWKFSQPNVGESL